MYSIAAAYFDPKEIIAFDIDSDALSVARENLAHYELEDKVKIWQVDILKQFVEPGQYNNYFDTIVMNPPFGTKNNEGVDMQLLLVATKALKPGG